MKPRPGKWARILICVIGIGLLIGLPVAATAESVTLAWDRNPEEDLAGYKVYIGTRSRAYTQTIDAGHVTSYSVSGLLPGETYYFVVTAYDIFANESEFSGEIRATIAEPAPPPPLAEPEPTPATTPAPAPTPVSEPTPAPARTPVADPVSPPASTSGGGSAGGSGGSAGGTSSSSSSGSPNSPPSAGPGTTAGPSDVAPGAEGLAQRVLAALGLRGARERELEAEHLHQEGRRLYEQGRIEEAILELRQAEWLWQSLPLSDKGARVALDLGMAYYAAGRYRDAIQAYDRALILYRQLHNRKFQARVLDLLAMSYEALGEYATAAERYQGSVDVWQELGEWGEAAGVLERRGAAQAAVGWYADALTSYRRSLLLFQELGDHEKMEELKGVIATVERLAGQTKPEAGSQ